MSELEIQTQVAHGQVSHCGAVSFGGINVVPATKSESARVEIVAWQKDSQETEVSLELGGSFEIAGQTWRLDAIHDDGREWYADLTRIA